MLCALTRMLGSIGIRRFAIPVIKLVRFQLISEVKINKVKVFGLHIGLGEISKFAAYSTLSGVVVSYSSAISIEDLLMKADNFFNENKFEEIIRLLEPMKHAKDADVLWRLCRAKYTLSKDIMDGELKKKIIGEADELIREALSLNDESSSVHKWMAILIDAKSAYYGTKEKIMQAYEIKKHMLRALELNPKDATVHHLLGLWCFEVAALPWYQRKLAGTIFAAPPDSSYEEALHHFLKAEEIDPHFYSMNYLMLGKTYLRLNDKEKGIFYLNLAREYPQKIADDVKAKEEAAYLLKNL